MCPVLLKVYHCLRVDHAWETMHFCEIIDRAYAPTTFCLDPAKEKSTERC